MTAMIPIAILDDYQHVSRDLADWSGLDVTVFTEPLANPAAALADFEVICIMRERTPFPRRMFDALPKLKLLVTTGARNAAIDLAAAADHGVTVCGTQSPGHATAELTWGLILALARNIAIEDRNMRGGRWQTTLGTDLKGKTLGVIGLGRMGAQVAHIGQAFGMNVVGWSRHLTDERAAETGVRRVDKETLLRSADVISIHMKYSAAIKGLVGLSELSLMKPGAFLINTSRGPIVDEAALITALKAGMIGGAGLDVYDQEPLPGDHPLRSAPRTVLSPHKGYVTEETYKVFYGETAAIVRAYLAGEPVTAMT